ncbi:MAG: BREX system Lon protease-like protein BrxL [Candidatus Sumerlaeota bacterium]|nr:BREX system Lon protease-like protein BrxL [Candidatus Sumerlaeota bacterium]
MRAWEKRLKKHFGSAAVDKSFCVRYDAATLPRHVTEYLLAQYLEKYADANEATAHLAKYVDQYIPRPGTSSRWHYRMQDGSRHQVVAHIQVFVNLEARDREPQVRIPALEINSARIDQRLLEAHPRLLEGGLWGKATLSFREQDESFHVGEFVPFQVSDVSLADYIAHRKFFSRDEWLEILISSIGLDPGWVTSLRERLVVIARLIPLVQERVFLVEIGPPGTGKTYILDRISSRSFVVSGSRISAAELFFNVATRRGGLLHQHDAILFDEIDKVGKSDLSNEVVNKLLKYMESGTFDRGGVELQSTASFVMAGNTLPRHDPDSLCFDLLPKVLQKEAFLDRISGLVPGWELKPVGQSSSSLTQSSGFSADYFSEVLSQQRKDDFIPLLRQRVRLESCSIRDENAVLKTAAGLVKIVHPDRNVKPQELQDLLTFAVEMRQAVLEQSAMLFRKKAKRILACVQ